MDEQKNTTQLLEQLGCKLDKIICLLENYFAPKIVTTTINEQLIADIWQQIESLKTAQKRQGLD